MSEEMVGQAENFLKGHEDGKREGYMKALDDIHHEINSIPTRYNSISVELVNGLIKKLKDKK